MDEESERDRDRACRANANAIADQRQWRCASERRVQFTHNLFVARSTKCWNNMRICLKTNEKYIQKRRRKKRCSSEHMQEESPCNAHTFDCRKLVFCALLAHGKNNEYEGKTNLASCAFELTAKTSQHQCTCSVVPAPADTILSAES